MCHFLLPWYEILHYSLLMSPFLTALSALRCAEKAKKIFQLIFKCASLGWLEMENGGSQWE